MLLMLLLAAAAVVWIATIAVVIGMCVSASRADGVMRRSAAATRPFRLVA